jgi:hypothetical protein
MFWFTIATVTVGRSSVPSLNPWAGKRVEEKDRLSVLKLVSNLVYRSWILEFLISSLLLRYEHRYR